MSQTSPMTGGKHPPFSTKVAMSAPDTLSSEAQEFVKTLESLIQQIKENPDLFTRVTEATAAHKATPSRAEQVEKEIAKGERQWFGTPRIFQTDSTYNWKRLASPVGALFRDTTITAAPLAPFMRNMPWLAAIPASIGAYRYVAQKLANNQLKYGMRKFGPDSMKGDFKYEKIMQGQANRNVQQQALEMFSHQGRKG